MKRRKVIFSILITFVVLFVTALSFATVLFKSYIIAEGSGKVNSLEKIVDVNDATKEVLEISSDTYSLNFASNGNKQNLNVTINNRTASVLYYQFSFRFDSASFNLLSESYASCILVYYNDKYVGTLSNLCSNSNYQVETGLIPTKNYVDKATNIAGTASDKLTFELDNATDTTAIDTSKPFNFKMCIYTQTADYSKNIFVHNVTELERAFNDISSGALDKQTIVLMNNITITNTYNIAYPIDIDLNGYVLTNNGKISFKGSGISLIKSSRVINASSITQTGIFEIDNSQGALVIDDLNSNLGYEYSQISRQVSYSSTLLKPYIIDRVKKNIGYGLLNGNSVNLFGGLSFYNITVTTDLDYSAPNLSANINQMTTTQTYSLTIMNEIIPVKVYQSADEQLFNSILTTDLNYLVALTETDIDGNILYTTSSDILLPTFIRDKNTTILWESSDPTKVSDKGIIAENIDGDATISLFGHFKVNNTMITHEFRIKVASQNHDTIFQYFVAQLSPITIEVMYTGDKNTAYYYLPIIDANYNPLNPSGYTTGYDYRHAYTTPTTIDDPNVGYTWDSFANVGFEELEYSSLSTYNFLAIDSSNNKQAVYLSTPTFQTFGQISLRAKFINDDDYYTGNVNVLIKTGYNTELNELVFTYVDQGLDEVNVLQNILNTRFEDGMIGERGDFELPGKYQTYYITYEIPSSSRNAIKEIIGYNDSNQIVARISGSNIFSNQNVMDITKYVVVLDPYGFGTNDSQIAINTVLVMPTGDSAPKTASRIQYFNVPGVIKPDDNGFANLSVFNSVKYQVWYELANNVTNEKGLDNVEQKNYTLSEANSFTVSNNVVTNHTGAYILRHDASLVSSLAFDTSENITNTDNHEVYGLMKVIDFITSDYTNTFGSKYSQDISLSAFAQSHSSVKSNGKKYLNDDEIDLIKDYYSYAFGKTLDLSNYTYLEKDSSGKSKYTLINSSEFIDNAKAYYSNTSTYGSNLYPNASENISKFTEVFQWAHNDKNFDNDFDTSAPQGPYPCGGDITKYDWSEVIGTKSTSWTRGSSNGSGWDQTKQNSKYRYVTNGTNIYVEDETEYFTEAELTILIVFMLNSKQNSNPSAAAKAYVQSLRDTYFVIPTYFENDGIGNLIKQAYEDLNKSVSGDANSGFEAELNSFVVCGETLTTPHVTSLDNSTSGLEYFTNLTTLYIHGDYDKLRAIHTTANLMQSFNRVTSGNPKIENLAFEYVSDSNVDFDISTLQNLDNLKKFSLCHNQGISNIGSIHQLGLRKLEYVDLSDINVANQYSEFTLKSIKYKTSQHGTTSHVYYSLDGTTTRIEYTQTLSSGAEGLIYLSDFTQILSENANLTQNVYVDETGYDVEWLIEEGNGIKLIDSNTVSNPNEEDVPYTDTYFVTNTFTYNNFTFEANKLYLIYKSGNTIGFSKLTDSNGDDIVLNFGSPAASLTEEEANAFLSNHPQQTTTYYDNEVIDSQSTSSMPTTTIANNSNSNNYPAGTNTNNRWVNNTGNNLSSSYYFRVTYSDGSNSENIRVYSAGLYTALGSSNKQITTTQNYHIDTYNDLINATAYKYYASVDSNGVYTITRYLYQVLRSDEGIRQNYTRIITDKYADFYYSNNRSGTGSNRRYIFKSILDDYFYKSGSTSAYATSLEFVSGSSWLGGNTTIQLTNTTYHSQTQSTNAGTSASTGDRYNSQDVVSNQTAVVETAMIANNSIFNRIIKSLSEGYITVSNAVTYYRNETSNAISTGIKSISLSTNGGFTYSAASNSSNLQIAFYMNNLLVEANNAIDTTREGLYYHNYYAYSGATIQINGNTYTNGYIYRLVINNNKYEFEQVKQYQVLTGSYTAVTNLVASLDSTYLGKVYYYSGSASNVQTQGSNLFYEVVYNFETGGYELKKFGVVSSRYDIASSNGNFNDPTTLNQYATPSNNINGLCTITNLMRYMDSTYFSTGSLSSSAKYTYGIGGTREAVVKAMIKVDGVNYLRTFLVKVSG
ncbi:MAG: hypothetical protein K6G28_04340 [Acholeplasmatales bacterium]|nr:hypothetical protein [Acholeplasmatales bacterium]